MVLKPILLFIILFQLTYYKEWSVGTYGVSVFDLFSIYIELSKIKNI